MPSKKPDQDSIMSEAVIPSQILPFIWNRWRTPMLYGVALAYLVFLFFYRLDVFPVPWFDEGAFLNVAKTYAEEGVYAESSVAGYRYTGPVVSTGPTVIVPIAIMFDVFGVSIPLARLVVAVYGILTFFFYYRLTSTLSSPTVAIVAAALAISSGTYFVPYVFRNVMGEGPGLFYVLAALWVWLRPGRRPLIELVCVGILFAMAGITKFQYALFILPSLLLVWILDLIWYRQQTWSYFIIPGIFAGLIVSIWIYYVLFVLGGASRATIEDLNRASTNAYLVIDPVTNLANFRTLIGDFVHVGLFVPAFLYGVVISWQRNKVAQQWGVLTVFLITSSSMFIFSIGWTKNAIPAIFFAALLISKFLCELLGNSEFDWKKEPLAFAANNRASSKTLLSVMAIGFAGSVTLFWLLPSIYAVATTGDNSAYQVGTYLTENVPQNSLIETWEKELSVLSDHDFHFPPALIETYHNEFKRGLGPSPNEQYDFNDYTDPEYVITGAFSNRAEIYPTSQLNNYELVQSIGAYDIYHRKAEN